MRTLSRLFPPAVAQMRKCAVQQHVPAISDHGRHKLVKDPARQDPEYFEKEAEKLPLDDYYLDKLKGLYEQKVSNQRDLFRKSTDLLVGNPTYGLPDVDRTQPRLEYRHVDVLRDAPDAVRRIFSVEYGERRDLTAVWKVALIERVRAHELDGASLTSRIAYTTACIRHLAALIDELIVKHPRGKHPKALIRRMELMINWRRKSLRILRQSDQEGFERLLTELKLVYKVPREEDELRTRKEWSEHQLRKRCQLEKEKRLKALHDRLAAERDERVAAIDAELAKLAAEEAQARCRLDGLSVLEGRTIADVRTRYEPKLVEEFTELSIHQKLFYFPPPAESRSGGALATVGV